MTPQLSEAASDRPLVLLTHLLPDWIGAELEAAFDLQLLDADRPEHRNARAMITPGPAKLDAGTLSRFPALELICAVGSGCEGIDTAYTRKHGVVVTNSASATAQDVADHTVAITLALYARIPALDRGVRSGDWPRPALRRSLRELNVGIVGLGAIGRAVASRLAPFGCEIRWTGPRFHETAYGYVAELGELARWADILIVAARADASNIGMIDEATIRELGPDGLLVNVSRGGIIDEEALISALKAGRLAGAALDVFAAEPTPHERWREVPNAVLTPHVGGFASGVQRGIQQLLAANLGAFFAGGQLVGVLSPRAG